MLEKEKVIETNIMDENELKKKRKIRLIIISKRGKENKEKSSSKSKITYKNEKGKYEIKIENMEQKLNKNKIDKTLKIIFRNISEFNIDKNEEKMYTSSDNKKKLKKKIINEKYSFYDIYLEKKKKKEKIKKNKEINEDNIIFQKIQMIKEPNLINNNSNDISYENDIIINNEKELKESNRVLIKKENIKNEEDNNIIINKNLNINNFFKNKSKEENKNNIKLYTNKNINNISRNSGMKLIHEQNSDVFIQSTNNLNKNKDQNIATDLKKITDTNISTNINSNINTNINYFINNLSKQKKILPKKLICSICDMSYTSNAFYVSECKIHLLCKKCAKYFYEERIDSGDINLFCPFISCKKKFPIEQAKKFLSKNHFIKLEEKKENNNKIKTRNDNNINIKKMKNYSENHVIDVNNNKLFYNFNKNKNIFCSRCFKETLFCREKQSFMRCLNCNFAQCKYCFKEYTKDHFDMNSKNYCRIYYRNYELEIHSLTQIKKFLLQLFLVFAIFYLTIISFWKYPKKIFSNIFFKKNENNEKYNNYFLFCVKIIFIYLFTLIIFIICLPINFLLFPWFPSFLALFDY